MKRKSMIALLLALTVCASLLAACTRDGGDAGQTTAVDAGTTVAGESAAETAAAAADATTAADLTTTMADQTDEPTEAQPEASVEEIPAADRTTANFAGTYGSGRCTIVAEAVDETTMKFSIHWGSSAFEASEWEMSGTLDPDTMRVNYSDCVHKTVVFAEDGTATETVVYEDGVGRIQFYDLHRCGWQDEQDNAGAGMEFTNLPPAE